MYILDFSDEIIERVLLCKEISSEDLCHLCQTCRRFNQVAQSAEIWKQNLFQRFVKHYFK